MIMPIYLLPLLILMLIGCAQRQAEPSSTEPLPPECHENEFRGFGVGENESEAKNIAYAEIARQISSSVKVTTEYATSQRTLNGNENLASQYESKMLMESALSNAQDVRIVRNKRNGNKVNVVACMSHSDAAKGFVDKIRPFADSLKFAANNVIETKHPRLKSEAWQKTKPLWGKFVGLYYIIQGLDKEKAAAFEPVATLYAKAETYYLEFCQTAKLHWNPEQDDAYSEIAFAKLSKNLKLEKTTCNGQGISLIYRDTGHKCDLAGIAKCSHKPSLLIASCYGEEYRLLENKNVETYQKTEESALEKLRDKLRYETFWNEWEQEIKQWRPICD